MASNDGTKLFDPELQLDLQDQRNDGSNIRSRSISLPRPDFFFRRRAPVPSPVFATYWRFAKKRQKAYFARLSNSGSNEITSGDPILRRHRFTNAYRASDRVSQYLIRHVLYNNDWSPNDLVFRMLVFKFFNKIETWEALERAVGEISWKAYEFESYDLCLSQIMAAGGRIYSAAYIMPSGRTAFGHERKHRNHLKVIEAMMADHLPDGLSQQRNLESVYRLLRRYPCVGPFVGYQFAIDLNYSPIMNFSENDFVEPGPGALDGIAKCFSDFGEYGPADLIRYMTDIQEDAFNEFAPGFRDLWGRPLHLIDCQNLFCEVGKYARVAHPEFEGRSKRTRIKQIYRRSPRPVEAPWYPPKWALNQRVAAERVGRRQCAEIDQSQPQS